MTTTVYTPKHPNSSPILVNKSPDDGGRRHGFDNSKLQGYLAVGKRRASHLEKNRNAIQEAAKHPYHYQFSGVVAINRRLDPRDYTGLIKRLKEAFKTLNVDGTGEVEISKGNVVQLNLIFRDIPAHLAAKDFRKLKVAIRKTTTVKLNQRYHAMRDKDEGQKAIGYFSKLVFWKDECKDIYKDKRALFAKLPPGQRIRRFFDFGKFWEKRPTKLNDEYKAGKRQREKHREQYPKAEEAAKEVFKQYPGQFSSREQIEDQWYEAYTQGSQGDLGELDREINDLAEDWYGGQLELAEALVRKKADRECQRKLLVQRGKRKAKQPKVKKPWTPDDIIESFTMGAV
jgi:hypothetical protein